MKAETNPAQVKPGEVGKPRPGVIRVEFRLDKG